MKAILAYSYKKKHMKVVFVNKMAQAMAVPEFETWDPKTHIASFEF